MKKIVFLCICFSFLFSASQFGSKLDNLVLNYKANFKKTETKIIKTRERKSNNANYSNVSS